VCRGRGKEGERRRGILGQKGGREWNLEKSVSQVIYYTKSLLMTFEIFGNFPRAGVVGVRLGRGSA